MWRRRCGAAGGTGQVRRSALQALVLEHEVRRRTPLVVCALLGPRGLCTRALRVRLQRQKLLRQCGNGVALRQASGQRLCGGQRVAQLGALVLGGGEARAQGGAVAVRLQNVCAVVLE
jgi:hypothetical protein